MDSDIVRPKKIVMRYEKKIALVAYDNKKKDPLERVKFDRDLPVRLCMTQAQWAFHLKMN